MKVNYTTNQELEENHKKAPRPIIIITSGLTSHSITTPKSMTLASDGYQEAADFTLAGNVWTVPAQLEAVEFYVGNFKVSYRLPPITISKPKVD